MNRKKIGKAFLVMMTAAVFMVSGVFGSEQATESLEEGISDPFAMNDIYAVTTFLDHPEYDQKIEDPFEGEEAMYSMIDDLGGDETTEFVFQSECENAEGTIFYSYAQAVGGIQVYGGSAKLIVDKEGTILGVFSSIYKGIQETPETAWEITQEEAEQIVAESHLDPGARVLPEVTGRTILTLSDNNAYYVWIVYTNNVSPETERAYLAHYVTGAGEYLYSVPVFAPGNEDALNGSVAIFAFEGYKADTWTGKVTDADGLVREITVPVMVDEETGTVYLGDMERRIICADYWDFANEDTLTPITTTDESWINNEVITYEMMIRVWDFYDKVGWRGPDGDGTPTLILMNYVDDNKEPLDNAFYAGKQMGFQVFSFNDAFGDGSCSDIVGHEFTHCVTGTSTIHDIYENDTGAINEGISDIMGNLIEMMFGDSPNGAWLFSERQSNGTIRNMKDPHEFAQPEYVWDLYYDPNVDFPIQDNDLGGVHDNCSILSQISWKLNEAGMQPRDQFYFWLNVDLVQPSLMDFPMMAEILPFILDMTGYSQYQDALKKAIEESRMAEKELPETIPAEQSLIVLDLPSVPAEEGIAVNMLFETPEWQDVALTWPIKGTNRVAKVLPPGDYIVMISFSDVMGIGDPTVFLATPEGWEKVDLNQDLSEGEMDEDQDKYVLHFEGGKITELVAEGLSY